MDLIPMACLMDLIAMDWFSGPGHALPLHFPADGHPDSVLMAYLPGQRASSWSSWLLTNGPASEAEVFGSKKA